MPVKKTPRGRSRVDASIPVPTTVRGHAHQGAYRKGYVAARAKKTERANPYNMKDAPVVRGLHYSWLRGFRAGAVKLGAS